MYLYFFLLMFSITHLLSKCFTCRTLSISLITLLRKYKHQKIHGCIKPGLPLEMWPKKKVLWWQRIRRSPNKTFSLPSISHHLHSLCYLHLRQKKNVIHSKTWDTQAIVYAFCFLLLFLLLYLWIVQNGKFKHFTL